MNFDQKAVKFLANFYIDGGKHWTHSPLRQETLMPLRPKAVWWGPCPWACVKARPPAVQEFPEGLRVNLGSLPESWRVCPGDWDRKQLWLEQRAPIAIAPDYPGPATYRVPDASVRESSPHPHFSIGRKRPIPEAAGRGAWQTVWIQSERPFSEKLPPLANHEQLSGHAFPAVSFVGRRPIPKVAQSRTPLRLLRARGAGRSARPPWQDPLRPPGERRPSPTAYDIAPGRRLQSLRPPAFSMSRSPALASWVHASRSPGPAAYHVEDCYNSRFPAAPGVLIQGVRRPKRHETGPFCSL
uniref:Sperm-tail PG-rich repeat containing 3 n=1 Tax=Pipistrellus kuhlii TaxID=59472 RepID=A0A7J7RWJ4_PIPKU|nr:sperm-tail PG-rich repeat containing 3 [Pipistrellus kuhlii]